MKTITLIIWLAQAFISTAATVSITDPGQVAGKTNTPGELVPYTQVRLDLLDSPDNDRADVYLIVEKRGLVSRSDAELYLHIGDRFAVGPVELNPDEQAILGPIRVFTNGIDAAIFAKVNNIEKYVPTDPASLAFDVVGMAVHGYTTTTTNIMFAGAFPLRGATHIINTNLPDPKVVKSFNIVSARDGLRGHFVVGEMEACCSIAVVESSDDLVRWAIVPQSVIWYGRNLRAGQNIVSTPTSGEMWTKGGQKKISWNQKNYNGPVSIILQTDSSGWCLTPFTTNTGSYKVILPNTFNTGNRYFIRVSEVDANGNFVSDSEGNLISWVSARFGIGVPSLPDLSFTIPLGNEPHKFFRVAEIPPSRP